jgi:serine/threonine protein kinase
MKKIGRFTIRGLLGKGGMGRVYKVTYPVTNKVAALKLLDPSPLLAKLTPAKDLEEMFTKEAVTMASIRHPYVVDILDFGRSDRHLYYVMDFFCNNLGTLMGESSEAEQTRVIPIEKAVHYTTQTLKGLSCLHFFGIIHRDIKPANILITDLDTARICDFGLSRRRGERKAPRHGSIRVGSPFYAAPEQETDPDQVDMTVDLYSTGVMLYKMLTGRLPGPDSPEASTLNPDLDEHWDRFIAVAMHPDPAERFQGADIMGRHLEDLFRAWEEKKEKTCAMPAFEDSLPLPVAGDPKQAATGSGISFAGGSDTGISDNIRSGAGASDAVISDAGISKVRGYRRQVAYNPLMEQTRSVAVRSEPKKIPLKQARAFFGLDRFMQPTEYGPNDFISSETGVVTDRHTGLVWQQSGTGFPMTWHQAKEYAAQLNDQQFGGFSDWRLPTLHELITLAVPPAKGADHCISPVFDRSQKFLWSADKCAYVSAWYMSLEMGFAARNDLTGFYHIKAVRSDT